MKIRNPNDARSRPFGGMPWLNLFSRIGQTVFNGNPALVAVNFTVKRREIDRRIIRIATKASPALSWFATAGHAFPRVRHAPIRTVPLGVPVKLQVLVWIAKRLAVCRAACTPPVSLSALARHKTAPVASPDRKSGRVTVLAAVRGGRQESWQLSRIQCRSVPVLRRGTLPCRERLL